MRDDDARGRDGDLGQSAAGRGPQAAKRRRPARQSATQAMARACSAVTGIGRTAALTHTTVGGRGADDGPTRPSSDAIIASNAAPKLA